MQCLIAQAIKRGEYKTVAQALKALDKGAPFDSWDRAVAAVMRLPYENRVLLLEFVVRYGKDGREAAA
jgi:hypothetical protein